MRKVMSSAGTIIFPCWAIRQKCRQTTPNLGFWDALRPWSGVRPAGEPGATISDDDCGNPGIQPGLRRPLSLPLAWPFQKGSIFDTTHHSYTRTETALARCARRVSWYAAAPTDQPLNKADEELERRLAEIGWLYCWTSQLSRTGRLILSRSPTGLT